MARRASSSQIVPVTERDLENYVKDLAKVFGYERYHTWLPIHSPAGFPDDVLCRPPRLYLWELKSEKGKLTPLQERWGDLLSACTEIQYRVVRPGDLAEVVEILR